MSRFAFPSRVLRAACVLALAGLLAGCWMSQAPLIGAGTASTVAFAGPYKPAKEEELVVEVTAHPDGSYSLIDNKGEGFTAFFLELREGWYLAQQDFRKLSGQSESVQAEDGQAEEGKAGQAGGEEQPVASEGPWFYNLVHLEGGDLWFYTPDCDEGTRAVAGVTTEDATSGFAETCTFPSLEALREAAPKFIRRIEAGEIKDEPGVLYSLANAPQ